MCGLFFSTIDVNQDDLQEISLRGPDHSNSEINELGFFYFFGLTTRKNNLKQPLNNSFGTLLYNGTQFDLEDEDNKFLIHNLNNNYEHCVEFIQTLNGDFSLIWITDEFILLARDFCGNKPLFYSSSENNFVAASTFNLVEIKLDNTKIVKPNEIIIFSKKNNFKIIDRRQSKIFDLSQTYNSLDRVFESFEKSVLSRYDQNMVIPVSSGIDSGMIAACLHSSHKKYLLASRPGLEDQNILNERLTILNYNDQYIFDEVNIDTVDKINSLPCQPYISQKPQIAQVGWWIAEYAKKNNCRYMMSGTGADELYSDYGWNGEKYNKNSQFGGLFPIDLDEIWPWHLKDHLPLYYSIVIEDYVYGCWGIDTRNPFLDTKLVQSWLSTTQELKNKEYKHWQQEYLRIKKFPYHTKKIPLLIPRHLRKFINN
jgi:asparagine synthetase B (glutamine-hydrolysing)